MDGDGKRSGREGPANDNRPRDGRDVGGRAETFECLDAVVLSIARLIGRRMAREDFEELQAANDNAPKASDERDGGDT